MKYFVLKINSISNAFQLQESKMMYCLKVQEVFLKMKFYL